MGARKKLERQRAKLPPETAVIESPVLISLDFIRNLEKESAFQKHAAASWRKEAEDFENDLKKANDLLAIVHGDGGQYTGKVGFDQSCKDAASVYYKLRADAEYNAGVRSEMETLKNLTDKHVARHQREIDRLRLELDSYKKRVADDEEDFRLCDEAHRNMRRERDRLRAAVELAIDLLYDAPKSKALVRAKAEGIDK